MSWEFEQKFVNVLNIPPLDRGTVECVFSGRDVWVFHKYDGRPDPNWGNYPIYYGTEGDYFVRAPDGRNLGLTIFNVWDSTHGNTSNKRDHNVEIPSNEEGETVRDITQRLPRWNTSDYERLDFNFYFDNNAHSFYKKRIDILAYDPNNSLNENDLVPYSLYHDNISAAKWYDKIYLLNGDIINAFDIEKQQLISSPQMPYGVFATAPVRPTGIQHQTCTVDIQDPQHPAGQGDDAQATTPNSNLCAANGKLYFTSLERTLDTNQQWLCIYNLSTLVWTIVLLPGRHQGDKRHIVDGLDGYLWITNKNNHAVIKVNVHNDTVEATVRVNRHPYRLTVNQGKTLFVASDPLESTIRIYEDPDLAAAYAQVGAGDASGYAGPLTGKKAIQTFDVSNGMISTVNQTTNAYTSYASGMCDGEGRFFDDEQGYLWYVNDNHFGRLRKSDKDFKTTYNKIDLTPPDPLPEEPVDPPLPVPTAEDWAAAIPMIPVGATVLTTETGGTADDACTEKPIILKSILTPSFTYQRWNGSALFNVSVKPYLFLAINTSIEPTPNPPIVYVWRGVYRPFVYAEHGPFNGTAYSENDVVACGDEFFVCKNSHVTATIPDGNSCVDYPYPPSGTIPLSDNWTLVTTSLSNPVYIIVYRDSDLVRKNLYQVRGTAMIATGEQQYYGD